MVDVLFNLGMTTTIGKGKLLFQILLNLQIGLALCSTRAEILINTYVDNKN